MTAIIAALLGASVAGYVSHVLTRRRDEQREHQKAQRTRELERREKVGLLKLVHSEITNNLMYLNEMADGLNLVFRHGRFGSYDGSSAISG